MKNEISLEDAKRRIYKKHGINIEIIEYINITNFAKFKCNICNHIWDAIPRIVSIGIGCPICYKKNNFKDCKHNNINNGALSFNYVKEYIESKNCKLLSIEYKNSKTPLIIQFECGHIGKKTTFESFKRGSRCRICGLEKSKDSRKYSMEKINKIMDDNNLIFIDFPDEYINRNSKIKYTCNYNHINYVAFSSFLKWHKCFVCSRIDLIDRVSGVNASNWQGGLTNIRDYLQNRISYWKKESIKQCGGECVISGKKYDDIHHVYSFNSIFKESIKELNFELKENAGDYKKEDLKLLLKKLRKLHMVYPLGVCLTRDWHIKFHNIYGYVDTTPQMWYEFLDKIKSGEIKD